MNLARIMTGVAVLLCLLLLESPVIAQSATEAALPELTEDCIPPVDCSSVTDPKLHKRSGRSYWGVATKKGEPEMEVLEKCQRQFELAYCGLPDDWDVNMFLGMVYCEFEKYECAGPFFERAIQLADKEKHRKRAKDNRQHYWVDHYNQALDMYKEEAFALAADEARIAVKIDPTASRGYAILGSAYASDAKYEEAIAVLERGYELDPNNETLAENLYAAYHNRGNQIFNRAQTKEEFAEAVQNYEKANAITPDDLGNLYYWGTSLLQLATRGDTTAVAPARQVISSFIELAESKDDQVTGLYNLALLEMDVEDWEAAEQAADRYCELAPAEADCYAIKSRVLIKTGKAQEAEAYIIAAKCLSEDPVADVQAWCDQAKQRYGAGSAFAKQIAESGLPDMVRVYTDSSGKDMLIVYYKDPGKMLAYYDGERRGEFELQLESSD